MILISVTDIQNEYVNMYRVIRNYIWDFDTVFALAELEIAVYTAFPDVDDIKNKFRNFSLLAGPTAKEDEELEDALAAFEALISEDNLEFYFELAKVQEVLKHDHKEDRFEHKFPEEQFEEDSE